MVDLFSDAPREIFVKPWKPRALDHDSWPPNYLGVYAWRMEQLSKLRDDRAMLASAKAFYALHPGDFIQHWMDTYNPRKSSAKWMPFVFFARQAEMIEFLEELRRDHENGLIEKSRDMGATWLACAYSVWCMLFQKDFAVGWGSRKAILVDKIGDPDSIFEKMRLLIDRLPDIWLPDGWNRSKHATYMKMINPENGSTITGESGDNIGRGGRKTTYFKDEAAHYARPELIEAALGDNTDTQVDMSSVNALGNVFHRRRESGIDWAPGATIEKGFVRVLVLDWRHHPEKDQAWYETRRARYEREGMLHVFAQEVDRNYSAAVQNTVISYEWLQACIDAHLHIPALRIDPPGVWSGGFDAADEGGDRNALALRQWIILRHVEQWGEGDPGYSTRRVIATIRERNLRGVALEYDCIGLGVAVKSEFNRLIESGDLDRREINFSAWDAGAAVVNPYDRTIPGDDESALNRDFFYNMRAQAWWSFRTRCFKTWRARTFGDVYPAEDLISFDSGMADLFPLLKELAQPTRGSSSDLRMLINKKPDGTRSPNMGDAVIQAFFPAPPIGATTIVGAYS